MIPIMPLCTLGDPLPYIYLVHIKTTTFIIENDASYIRLMIPIMPLCTLGDPLPGSYQDNNIRYRK